MRTIHACALVALVSLPAGAGAFIAACGGTAESVATDCQTNCEASNNCPGASSVDCTSQCANDADLNTASGCTDPYNAEQACVAGLSDACTSTSACNSSLGDYKACITAFCMVMPTPAQCNNE